MLLDSKSWQIALADAFRTVSAVYDALELPISDRPAETDTFPLLVPRDYLNRMRKGDPNDPLFKQVVFDKRERDVAPGFSADPVGEHDLLSEQGIIQKYNGRALVVMTGGCAVNCRYCFRRHFPYQEAGASLPAVMNYLEEHPDIHEVILSGGDPLLVPDLVLTKWLRELATLSHLKVIRIHSRIPVVLPERMTDGLADVLTGSKTKVVLVTHANHAQELQGQCAHRLRYFSQRGITIYNQSVLLKDVNDSVSALSELSWKLIELGVSPYYLHQLDRVAGASHFQVDDARALELVEALRSSLPGYLVPRLVREVAGDTAKTPLYPSSS